MTRASICTIGDEILIGQIVDTNSSHIARELNKCGVKVESMLSIGDNRESILTSLEKELSKNEIVIVTGGLGPTKDDITKKVLAELSGAKEWKEDPQQLAIIQRILHSRGLDVLDINRAQALVPQTCEVIPNQLGTAPIMVFRFASERFGHPATLYALPGVPFEALGALKDVIEDICTHNDLQKITHRTIMTYGIAESALAKRIEEWEDALPQDIHLAYLPNALTGVRLRLSAYGEAHTQQERIEAEIAKLKGIIGDVIYSYEDDTLQNCIGKLLKQHGKTISTAESCTGGLVASMITSVAGSSEYYLGSVVSYANSVKQEVLGVPAGIIQEFGAVSSECVGAMAEGVRKLTGTDFSVATSGIAGPGGGSTEKPVGLVWIGVSSQSGTQTYKLTFNSDRKRNIERFASSALYKIFKKLEKELND